MQAILMWTVLWISALLSTERAQAARQKPRLVVVIAVDQLRSDYLTRFEHLFLPAKQGGGSVGGFRYLMSNGAYFQTALMPHALNVTGLGHAVMLTGSYPYLHGITSHRWFEYAEKKKTYCVLDKNVTPVGSVNAPKADDGRSPKNLLVSTVGDEMKNAWGGRSLVAGVSLKDRSAILMAGHRADLAIWFDEASRGFVTSTYYAKGGKLPTWLERWNKTDYIAKKVPETWTKLLPEKEYWLSTPMPPETVAWSKEVTKSFPHPIKNDAKAFVLSPWGNDLVFDTSLELARSMKFGADEVPDLLALSLSSFDAIGHNFGFMSEEMQDSIVRVDRALANFLNALARQVPGGLKNVAIILTGDHGITVNHSMAERLRLPGGAYWAGPITEQANAYLREKFSLSSGDNVIVHFEETNIAFDHDLLKRKNKDVAEVARALASWLRPLPFIAAAYAKADLLEGRVPPTPYAKRLAISTHPTRSADVVFAARPGFAHLPDKTNIGVDHETPSVQESSVPLIFAGPWFKSGRFADEPSMADLAPTLSKVLGLVAPSGSQGQVISKIIP